MYPISKHGSNTLKLPKLIVHCDWGSSPAKRKMVWAYLNYGSYCVGGVKPVGTLGSFLESMRSLVEPEDNILVGFDFPIGLPYQHARLAGIDSFIEVLPKLGYGIGLLFLRWPLPRKIFRYFAHFTLTGPEAEVRYT